MTVKTFLHAALGALVFASALAAAEVVVRDTIGASNEHVSGSIGAIAFQAGHNFFGVPGVVVVAPVAGTVGFYTGTYYGSCYDGSCGSGTEQDPFDVPWQEKSYMAYVWTGGTEFFFQEFGGDGGDLWCTQDLNCIFHPPVVSVSDPVGVYFHPPTGDYLRQRNLTFDLTPLNISVTPGQEIVVAVVEDNGDSDAYLSLSTWDGHAEPDAADVFVSVFCQPGGCGPQGCGVCADYVGPTGLDWGFKWFGARLTLITDDTAVPTVSTWGMVVMTLLVVTAGTLIIGRRAWPRTA